MNSNAKILIVDDEPNVLQGYQRHLRNKFQLDFAQGGKSALQVLETSGPYAVIVTDMRMPSMNGIELLQCVKRQYPETVRLMLTGFVDLQTAVNAVNDGCVYRFLTKPCSPELMAVTLTAAVEQYALVTAERDLLSKTLRGSVDLLADILSMLNPVAFGCAVTIRRLCTEMCERLAIKNSWDITIAATLALIGCIAIPEQILVRLHHGESLSIEDRRLFDGHPQIGGRLLSRIPRLEQVAEIVRRQNEPYVTTASRGPDDRLGFAANILKCAIDFEMLVAHGTSHADAILKMQTDRDRYRPEIVSALAESVPTSRVVREVNIADMCDGMILDENLVTLKGELLLSRGNEVSATLRERLTSLSRSMRGVKEPVRVLCQS